MLRDRSFGKRKKVTLSPDHNSRYAHGSKTSIFDKVRRKVDSIIKAEKNEQLFTKSPTRYQSSKVFEKKSTPLIETTFNEEESRELTIIKDAEPQIDDKSDLIKEVYVKRACIEPVVFHKPYALSKTNSIVTVDSPSFKLEMNDMRDKLLSAQNEGQQYMSTDEGSDNAVKRRINFDSQTIVPFAHQIQSTYSSLYKSYPKPHLDVNESRVIVSQRKQRQTYKLSTQNIINQEKTLRPSFKTSSELSESQTDEINSLKEEKLRGKNEMKFLSMSINKLKRDIAELNEEVDVSKFERDNAITNYNKAAMKIQELHREVDRMQNKLQRSSSQLGQLIDYLYRLNDPKHIEELEQIIGTEEKQAIESVQAKADATSRQLAEVMDLIYLSKDKELIEKVSTIRRTATTK